MHESEKLQSFDSFHSELQQAWAELKQARESVVWWQGVAEAKQEERDAALATIAAAWSAALAKGLQHVACAGNNNDATVSLADVLTGAAAELERRRLLHSAEFERCTKLLEVVTKIGDQCDRLIDETDRLRSALMMLAQIRSVNGNAQPTFRMNLRTVDAVLAGADVRNLETVEAIASGTWKPTPKGAL